MAPRKSRAKPKEDVNVDAQPEAPKSKRAPDIQWAKNPDWTYTLIAYLGDHVSFRLKLFSDSTADATKEGRPKLTAKDGKIQQYAVLAKHIFADEPGQSSLYLQNPGRYGTAVETRLRRYDHLLSMYISLLKTLQVSKLSMWVILRSSEALEQDLTPTRSPKEAPLQTSSVSLISLQTCHMDY
jgi:hypothetical protein